MNIGDIVWTCNQSIESESYYYFSPREPWRGKITKIIENKPTLCHVSYLSKDGVVDEDANATAFCSQDEIFPTKELAQIEYIKNLRDYISDLKEKVAKYTKILHENENG